MKQILNIILVAIFTISNVSFAQTKVDGSLLKGNVIGGTASNTRRLVVPKDTKTNLDALTRIEGNLLWSSDSKKAWVDNGTNLVGVGSGSGGGVNYITDGDAESASASIFVPYADAAATRPVDGTGGSPTVTTSITSTAPLAGTKSFLLTKPASNVQGQGWAIPFTVDLAYAAKMQKITFDYIVNSGTFVAGSSTTDSDVIWYIYDVTNSTLIEPSNIKMFASSTTLSDKFQAEFQTSATGSSYRLIAHVASTSALAYELKVDNISIAPSQYVYAPVVTDWKSYTPTGAWTTNTSYLGKYRQVGDTMEIEATVTLTGAPNATDFNITIPSGFSIDTTKLTSTDANKTFGSMSSITAGNYYHGSLWYLNTTTLKASMIPTASASANSLINVSNTNPATFANGDRVYIKASVPIVGWTSNTQQSDGYDARPIIASGVGSITATTITNVTKVPITSTIEDSALMINANGDITVKTSGWYDVEGISQINSGGTINTISVTINIGGVSYRTRGQASANTHSATARVLKYINAGQIINFYTWVDTGSYAATVDFNIKKDQAPTTISAQARISASYALSGAPSTTANTPFNYSVKEWDTHGAVTVGASWKFIAPAPGEYDVLIAGSNGSSININLWKNGASFKTVGTYVSTDQRSFTIRVELNAGEYIDARPTTTTSHGGFIQIRRVK